MKCTREKEEDCVRNHKMMEYFEIKIQEKNIVKYPG
jgi:hypothetical protein